MRQFGLLVAMVMALGACTQSEMIVLRNRTHPAKAAVGS
jgi:hypothetical protein